MHRKVKPNIIEKVEPMQRQESNITNITVEAPIKEIPLEEEEDRVEVVDANVNRVRHFSSIIGRDKTKLRGK